MKIKILKFCLLACCVMLSAVFEPSRGFAEKVPLYSTTLEPAQLDLGFSQRFRYEYLDEFNIKKYGTGHDDSVLLSRTRLYLRYTINQGPQLYLEGQDSRFWFSDDIRKGDYIQKCPYYNEFDLRQAYLDWRKIAGTPFGFKAGRQTIGYGDDRIFGPGNWGNVGRHLWDAAILFWEQKIIKLDLIYGQKILYDWNSFDDDHVDYQAFGAYAQTKPVPGLDMDFFYVLKENKDNNSGDDELTVQTAGIYAKSKFKGADGNISAAYQFGDNANKDISAYMIHAEAGYTVPCRFTPRFSAAFTIGSGDNDPDDNDYGTYDGVFGAVAKYYGRMNLFSGSNLKDSQVGLAVKPYKGISCCIDYHWFRLAEEKDAWYYCNNKVVRQDKTGAAGSDLGEEIDFTVKYKLNPNFELMAGYACFFPGEFVENTGSAEDAHWAFTQVMVSY